VGAEWVLCVTGGKGEQGASLSALLAGAVPAIGGVCWAACENMRQAACQEHVSGSVCHCCWLCVFAVFCLLLCSSVLTAVWRHSTLTLWLPGTRL
jgi:hypothetical protein